MAGGFTMNEEFSKGCLCLDVWARLNSTFAGHYDNAFLSSSALILASLIKSHSRTKQILLGFLIFCYYLLLNTASRVSFVAYLIAIFCLLIF